MFLRRPSNPGSLSVSAQLALLCSGIAGDNPGVRKGLFTPDYTLVAPDTHRISSSTGEWAVTLYVTGTTIQVREFCDYTGSDIQSNQITLTGSAAATAHLGLSFDKDHFCVFGGAAGAMTFVYGVTLPDDPVHRGECSRLAWFKDATLTEMVIKGYVPGGGSSPALATGMSVLTLGASPPASFYHPSYGANVVPIRYAILQTNHGGVVIEPTMARITAGSAIAESAVVDTKEYFALSSTGVFLRVDE